MNEQDKKQTKKALNQELENKMRILANFLIDRTLSDLKRNNLQYPLNSSNMDYGTQ